MELSEIPECPVCLQCYDSGITVPRVLACGHTVCEACLGALPQKHPLTIRCPACTQLVKFPKQGPSLLPKNIDLLNLIPNSTLLVSSSSKAIERNHSAPFAPTVWSDETYSSWKKWIIPRDDVLVDDRKDGRAWLKSGSTEVRLFQVRSGLSGNVCGSTFKPSYTTWVLSFLDGIGEESRKELSLILESLKNRRRICRVYGLWGDVIHGVLFVVSETLNGGLFEKLDGLEDGLGLGRDGLLSFAVIGMEICEAAMSLHSEGLVLGCSGESCFELDDFGHVNLNLSAALDMGREIFISISPAGYGDGKIDDKLSASLLQEFLKRGAFLSLEVFVEMSNKKSKEVDFTWFKYLVGRQSDVWSLACLFLRLLLGNHFTRILIDPEAHANFEGKEANGLESIEDVYVKIKDNACFLLKNRLGEDAELVQQILCSCLDINPNNRPCLLDVWNRVRELIIGSQFKPLFTVDGYLCEESNMHCLVLGELCNDYHKISEPLATSDNKMDETPKMSVYKDFSEGIVDGKLRSKDMVGHLDCVTGLVVGGGFLFSSSIDKSVHVWSLKDLTHVHAFKGHEHKIMAIVYVDEVEPLCVSGDSGGGIYLWSIQQPLGKEPLMKWQEEKDWRYTGIRALVVAENGFLYTGSGDRLVKAWSLQDGSISCIMDGHKSAVSSLAVCNGVLHSGSWDGTVRMWSLIDHSLLAVLGDGDAPGCVSSVLALAAFENTFLAAHENGHVKVAHKLAGFDLWDLPGGRSFLVFVILV